MANWFDQVTKTLADEKLGRRQALKTIAGTVAGAAVASAIPGLAMAAPEKKQKCTGGNCTIGFTNCGKQHNTNCYCFSDTKGKGFCGCNSYCASIPPCSSSSQCGKKGFCSGFNGCTGCNASPGVCIPNCTKTCVLSSDHAGRTAAF